MASHNENIEFRDAMTSGYLLDEAIGWISKNLNPEDVFKKEALTTWAENNGMGVKE
jgi:hypothetical protein